MLQLKQRSGYEATRGSSVSMFQYFGSDLSKETKQHFSFNMDVLCNHIFLFCVEIVF